MCVPLLSPSFASAAQTLLRPIGVRYPISTCGRPGPIPWFLAAGPLHSEARLEGTPTQSLNMKSAGSVRSRPQCHCRDPSNCRGHHGGFCSTRTRRGVSTSPWGGRRDVSPTAASALRGHSGEAVVECYVERWGSDVRGFLYFVRPHTRSTVRGTGRRRP